PPPPPAPANPNPIPTPSNPTPEKSTAQTAFTATLLSVGSTYEAPLRERTQTLHANAAALQRQETELARTTADLARLNSQWAGVADTARIGLKEIGDVQNWAEVIERELLVLEDVVSRVEGGDSEDGEGEGRGRGRGRGMKGREGKGKGKGKGKDIGGERGKGWFRWW
ncbi:hypothetical protein BO70DRAFT_296636, partial [Aspergillus heteromorphus CBS 117.55]